MGQNASIIQLSKFPNTILASGIFTSYFLYRIYTYYVRCEITKNCDKKIIFVTGCDSGFGFKMAAHAKKLGYTVFAACYNSDSDGAKILKSKWSDIHILEMDVTKIESVTQGVKKIEDFLKNNQDYVLWAIVNNAGILVFGEFEWQTDTQITDQFSVNTLGTMRVTKNVLPLLRLSKTRLENFNKLPRIIVVTSHCAFEALPGISTYAASKAALVSWLDGLRCEIRPHGISVTQIIPGRVKGTKIMSNTRAHAQEMWEEMNEEQREYYGHQFERYYSYLDISGTTEASFPTIFDDSDKDLRQAFESAIFDSKPKRKYMCEPWQYKLYRIFAAMSPTIAIRDYVTIKFVRTPQWRKKNS